VHGFDVQDKQPVRKRIRMTGIENNDTVYAWWSADLFKLCKICRCFGSVISEMCKIHKVIARAEITSQKT
jgi:hypothetical protein